MSYSLFTKLIEKRRSRPQQYCHQSTVSQYCLESWSNYYCPLQFFHYMLEILHLNRFFNKSKQHHYDKNNLKNYGKILDIINAIASKSMQITTSFNSKHTLMKWNQKHPFIFLQLDQRPRFSFQEAVFRKHTFIYWLRQNCSWLSYDLYWVLDIKNTNI